MRLSTNRPNAGATAAEIIAWTEGWVRSRGHESPTPIPGGVHIRVGTEAESARYVLTSADRERTSELASQVTEPNFWIKRPAGPDEPEPVMREGWRLFEPQFFMGARLERTSLHLPDGYRLTLDDEGDSLEARVRTDSGTLAARGRLGLSTLAVPDQIVTQREHQRRGLGHAIMAALSNAALDRGASEAVLLASEQGRRLYDALGWRVLTPFWTMARPA